MKFHQISALVLSALAVASKADSDTNTASQSYTLWFVVFNQPSNCVGSPCGMPDVFGDAFLASIGAGSPDPSLIAPNAAAEIGVIWAAGGNSDEHGKINLTAGLYKNVDPIVTDGMVDPLGLEQGWTNPDAEVHLVLRHHGPALEEGNLAQVSNILDPYCSDALLVYEGEEANGSTCSDVQDIIVMAGESGELPVYEFGTEVAVEGARAIVSRRGDDLIQFIFESHDLEEAPGVVVSPKAATTESPKSAVTMWWVIFNNPAACTTNPEAEIKCGSGDLAVPEALPAALWAAGDVADDHGMLHLTSGLYRTVDPLTVDEGIDFKGLSRGWTSPDAEIHLVIRDHGPVVYENDGYLEQIGNFNDMYEGCCENVQAAPFAANEEGDKMLYVMADTTMIEGTQAVLNRRGDLLQAIVSTVDPAMVAMTGEETEEEDMTDPNEEEDMTEEEDPTMDESSDATTLGATSGGPLVLISIVAAMFYW